jgi:ssDNA-binding Zn-finger/Zn-ribbon topoisomerase 1
MATDEADANVCPGCGNRFFHLGHVERGRGSSFRGRDTCPMCGEAYDSYLDHLKTCSPE